MLYKIDIAGNMRIYANRCLRCAPKKAINWETEKRGMPYYTLLLFPHAQFEVVTRMTKYTLTHETRVSNKKKVNAKLVEGFWKKKKNLGSNENRTFPSFFMI